MVRASYGSNMDEAQMRARVPGAAKVATGTLRGYEFVFSGYSQTWGGAVANVRKKTGASVFGVVYALPPSGQKQLDRFEGYPHAYQRRTATVTLTKGGRASVFFYFKRAAKAEAPPNPQYVAQILRALRKHGAP